MTCSSPTFRGLLFAWLGALCLMASPAIAQSPPTPPRPPSAPPGSNPNLLVEDSSHQYVEWGVVVVGLGAAVYAVCRSSRRL